MKITWECKELTVSVSCEEDMLSDDHCSIELEASAHLLSKLIYHMQLGNPEYVLAMCLESEGHDYHCRKIYSEVDRCRAEMFKAAEAYRVARDEEYELLLQRAAEMEAEDLDSPSDES